MDIHQGGLLVNQMFLLAHFFRQGLGDMINGLHKQGLHHLVDGLGVHVFLLELFGRMIYRLQIGSLLSVAANDIDLWMGDIEARAKSRGLAEDDILHTNLVLVLGPPRTLEPDEVNLAGIIAEFGDQSLSARGP